MTTVKVEFHPDSHAEVPSFLRLKFPELLTGSLRIFLRESSSPAREARRSRTVYPCAGWQPQEFGGAGGFTGAAVA
jgi:hypothetical protein